MIKKLGAKLALILATYFIRFRIRTIELLSDILKSEIIKEKDKDKRRDKQKNKIIYLTNVPIAAS